MSITEIVGNIDRRLSDLDAELVQLTAARAALLESRHVAPKASTRATPARAAESATATPAPAADSARTARSQTRRRRSTPAYDVVPVGKLTALLGEHDGLRTRQLAEMTGGDPALILTLLKEREADGDVRRSGSRTATRWHLITDEDRIAARAAELAARSARPRARATAG